ncbi:hypothetical protein FB565_003389 [Actinoplanes lutulentus]|uniref:hypothetical protein n=1 Tax=Actinoplanes lutulentus TaxID=1287878 RepID=UPI000DB98EAF|nr:hypothetical protein [Actinoplanes lutulentus]MBB2943660.1 hypothetical protein [Actinoplanes lutulentus]
MLPLTDVVELGYPTVLVNLGAVVVIAIVVGTILRLLDPRLPGTSTGAQDPELPEVPQPRSGAEAGADQESSAGR